MSNLILCGPCGYAKNKRNAKRWCTVCEEGLCCVPSHDRVCSDVIPLDKAAENAKCSTALVDLEDTLTKTLQNLQQIINDRAAALEKLYGQKQTIKNTINDTRVRIIQKLDDSEQKILLELDTQHGECKFEVSKLLNRVKNSESDLNFLKELTSQLKLFLSDIRLFLGTRQINEAVFKEVESVRERIKSVQNYEIYLQLHPVVMAFMNEIDQLGKISIKKTTINILFKEAKADRAQMQLPLPEMTSIYNVCLKLKKKFKVKHNRFWMGLSGCNILPNGNLLIANNYGNNALMEHSEDGQHIHDIPCSS
ncbi:unnamed protein product [Mytilus coruscus]|uniref:B box-type domain-containing protein n=1 Tax=Mytilus coruscus TaxID=42192 RepID=A0A6J8CK71_MYTCO|nr:unnamed protein product [Mytilus coruscus]